MWLWATVSSSFNVSAIPGTAKVGIAATVSKNLMYMTEIPQDTENIATEMLNARGIGEEAEKVALALAREDAFESFYSYLTVDEPAVHLLPLHFLPHALRGKVGESLLHDLAVAAKFEYARNRWLDAVADRPDSVPGLSSTHRFNDALLELISSRYSRVLDGAAAGAFFPLLSSLYARHGLSLALDSTWYLNPAYSITLEEYAEHARMRHGPVRAAVDAVLLSVGAEDDLLERARSSWHNCALGIQFYDDALDIEEDFRYRNLSWTVTRTLEYFDGHPDTRSVPDPDAFYEVALTEGVISETLNHAESFFAESGRLADSTFPSWVTYQQACVSQTRRLREDYEKLISHA
jgi:hypothetical protein